MMKAIILAGLLFFLHTSLWAASSLKWDYLEHPRPTRTTVYEISGNNTTEYSQIVIVRLDDQISASYAQRVNEERWVRPGPFSFSIQPASLQTPQNRFLDLENLFQMLVFTQANIAFSPIIERQTASFRSSFLFDFGPQKSPVFPGFSLLDKSSPLLKNSQPTAFIRKGADSLIRDGLKGITQIEIPLKNGLWHIHMWTEDIGEWETLPPLYERRIRINGHDISVIRQNHEGWIRQGYLLGKKTTLAPTPWQAFGKRRGGLVSHVIEVKNRLIKIELAGSTPQATSLTALIIEPFGTGHFKQIQKNRKTWFQSRWPYEEGKPDQSGLLSQNVFAGETLFMTVPHAQIKSVHLPQPLSSKILYATASFRRKTAGSGLLLRQNHRYSPDIEPDGATILRIHIPSHTPPASYIGNLRLTTQPAHTFTLKVSPFPKPVITKSIGLYLENAPHIKDQNRRSTQAWCDLDFLRNLGFTAMAPPLGSTPTSFHKDLKRAQSFGFRDILAYTPIKRMDKATLKNILKHLDETQTKQPLWSIADEPSNTDQAQNLAAVSAFLQTESQFAKRAGHLNNPSDVKYLRYLDLVLINAGFGVNPKKIKHLKKAGITPWLYNMQAPRLATGFYLWKLQAEGYLHWHARMPSADPFDPTDGREDDVQLLYPSAQLCLAHPDIDLQLIEMVQGLSDLRWLLWLDKQAQTKASARKLQRDIHQKTPAQWEKARSLPPAHWDNLKVSIQKLASSLQY